MRAIKSRDTKMEVVLAKALWERGYRFRRNSSGIFGKPDFSLKKYKIAIFVDSEYFHGKDWETEKYRIKSNREFWWKKIESNIRRDQKVNAELRKSGWRILRFWTMDIRKNPDLCLLEIDVEMDRLRNV